MTELFRKSLENIEYPAVLQMLSDQAVSEQAKADALALEPLNDRDEIETLLTRCTDACRLLGLYGAPSFSGVRDVSGALKRAEMGGVLSTGELLRVAGVLRAAREADAYGDGDAVEGTSVRYLFRQLTPNRPLEERITTSIVSEEEIADAASPALASIRRQMRAANSRIREVLQKMITSAQYQSVLQEPIITMRSGRYVVPVKAEFKNAVSGLVHDVSSSGATLFIEPMQVVQANNEIRELSAQEKAEIERILSELSAQCDECREDIRLSYDALVALDLLFAKAKLSYRMDAAAPKLAGPGEGLLFRHARHPLLPRGKAVPIDVELGNDFDTLIITGPNTGGKTVALKTLGLLSMMAQTGLHIPADDGSRVKVFGSVLADIGDEQSIEQSLSTFSAHMTNIIAILGEADGESLLLFDEIGAGTDPVEGAALAIAVIEDLRKWGCCIAATTHYAELKVFATSTPGVANASCEFDVKTLQPTYKLLIGVPGKSNAFAISRRLGLEERIIESARTHMDTSNTAMEDVLEELEKSRQEMESAKAEAQRALREAETLRAEARETREKVREIRQKAEEQAKRDAQRMIDETRAEADLVMRELSDLRKMNAKNENWQEINARRAALRHRLNEAEAKIGLEQEEDTEVSARPARAGDTVRLKKLGSRAEVISVGEDGLLNLQAGILKITARQDEVVLLEGESAPRVKLTRTADTEKALKSLGASGEVDLRGMMTDEASAVLERYLDTALMANLNTVTIIHGKGTGALRQMVHQTLRRNKRVKSFRLGKYGEGDNGVTIAELA